MRKMEKDVCRAEALIKIENIVKNYKYTSSLVGNAKVIAVVKAEAYGHGAVEVARVLEENGCEIFAVATVNEGEELRSSGIKGDILILGMTPFEMIDRVVSGNMIQTVGSTEYAESISKTGKSVRIHIKIDTGMSRLGLYCHSVSDAGNAAYLTDKICNLPGIKAEGIFTHFALSDDISSDMTKKQFENFTAVCEKSEEVKKRHLIRHCCNSAAILNYPEMHLDAVRAGMILYGLSPDGVTNYKDLHPAMELVSRIMQVSHIKKGDTVSYGASFTAKKDMYIAAISIGYADGYFRAFSGKADVLIHGHRARIVGRICMDICMADITELIEKNIRCEIGDEVVLFGEDITADELAYLAGTINYEVICSVRNRVPRRYI